MDSISNSSRFTINSILNDTDTETSTSHQSSRYGSGMTMPANYEYLKSIKAGRSPGEVTEILLITSNIRSNGKSGYKAALRSLTNWIGQKYPHTDLTDIIITSYPNKPSTHPIVSAWCDEPKSVNPYGKKSGNTGASAINNLAQSFGFIQ